MEVMYLASKTAQLSPMLCIFFIMIVRKISTDETTDGAICTRFITEPKTSLVESPDPAIVFRGQDVYRGCLCQKHREIYVLCYGTNCTRMPSDINITAPLLKLSGTHITELKPGDFKAVPQLESLQIENNHYLSKILPGAFNTNLTSLTNLSISYSPNLRNLHSQTFQGLVSLRTLYLIKNGFENVSDVTIALPPNALPSLLKLFINKNNFLRIDREEFSTMENSTLEELSLAQCGLGYVWPRSLLPLKRLKVLNLGENNITYLTITQLILATIKYVISLEALHLFSMGYSKPPTRRLMLALAKSNVSNLNLARNEFKNISSEFFPYMPNLKVLDLRDVSAEKIDNSTFVNLPHLRTLLLGGNKLKTLPRGIVLPNLTYLDLQPPNLTFRHKFLPFDYIFTSMGQLQYLNLNFNTMFYLSGKSFIGLSNLKFLGMKNSSISDIQRNSFKPLVNLIILNLENNLFFDNSLIEHDYKLGGIFAGLERLEILLLGGCGIRHLTHIKNPFANLKSLTHLGLDKNQVHIISDKYFKPPVLLETTAISKNLEVLILHRNRSTLPVGGNMLENFLNSTQLEMMYNLFISDNHSFSTFCQWLYDKKRLKHVDVKAHRNFSESANNHSVLNNFTNVENVSFISDKNEISTKLIVTVSLVPLLFLIALLMFGYYYRSHLRYLIFLTRLYLSRKGTIRPETEMREYQYDAFISYSNEDRDFVAMLVPMLENHEPHLKLCVYERDFLIGTLISESVLESIAQSRRTLLIISDNYAKSQWCRWETHIAEHHRLLFKSEAGGYVDDSLVLIKLGPVSKNHLTPTLKYLIKTRIYLQWEEDEHKQQKFWEKLRKALAPPKNEQTVFECTSL